MTVLDFQSRDQIIAQSLQDVFEELGPGPEHEVEHTLIRFVYHQILQNSVETGTLQARAQQAANEALKKTQAFYDLCNDFLADFRFKFKGMDLWAMKMALYAGDFLPRTREERHALRETPYLNDKKLVKKARRIVDDAYAILNDPVCPGKEGIGSEVLFVAHALAHKKLQDLLLIDFPTMSYEDIAALEEEEIAPIERFVETGTDLGQAVYDEIEEIRKHIDKILSDTPDMDEKPRTPAEPVPWPADRKTLSREFSQPARIFAFADDSFDGIIRDLGIDPRDEITINATKMVYQRQLAKTGARTPTNREQAAAETYNFVSYRIAAAMQNLGCFSLKDRPMDRDALIIAALCGPQLQDQEKISHLFPHKTLHAAADIWGNSNLLIHYTPVSPKNHYYDEQLLLAHIELVQRLQSTLSEIGQIDEQTLKKIQKNVIPLVQDIVRVQTPIGAELQELSDSIDNYIKQYFKDFAQPQITYQRSKPTLVLLPKPDGP